MGQILKLYTYWRSSCSWRVKWALTLKGVPYEEEAVNLLKGEQRSTQHLARNPRGAVPTLFLDGHYYSESLAILEWLEESYPLPRLLPTDPSERMYVRQLSLILISGTQPLQNLEAMRFHSDVREEQVRYAAHWIKRGLEAFEARLLPSRGGEEFSFGKSVSLADLCLVPQCYNALRFGVDLADFPRIKCIYETSLQTEACQKTFPVEPSNWGN